MTTTSVQGEASSLDTMKRGPLNTRRNLRRTAPPNKQKRPTTTPLTGHKTNYQQHNRVHDQRCTTTYVLDHFDFGSFDEIRASLSKGKPLRPLSKGAFSEQWRACGGGKKKDGGGKLQCPHYQHFSNFSRSKKKNRKTSQWSPGSYF